MVALGRSLIALIQEVGRANIQSLGCVPDRQKRDILLSTLDEADIGAVHAHAFSQGFLPETCLSPIAAKICAEYFPDVHPQDRRRLRILALRIKIPENGRDCEIGNVKPPLF